MAYHFDTQVLHPRRPLEEPAGAVTFPIYQTSTYAQIEPGVTRGYSYSRTENPTRKALEDCIAGLEEARFGFCYASGMAAISGCLNLLSAGDHVVACRDLYGGAYRIFTKVYSRFGIDFTFAETTCLSAIERAITPRTKLLWLESPSNPLLKVTDLAAAAALARARRVTVVVDNTFATPFAQRPLALGADIVLHSTTKYLNGHADVIGGALVTDDEELAARLKFLQNAVGAIPGPQDCFLTLRGLKTLPLRMERHCENARRVAEFLSEDARVSRVYYPGLPDHPGHDVATRQQRGYGAIVSFEVAGGLEGARRFAARPRLFTLAESLGAATSLFCHPATMTHASIEPDVRRENGISDGLIRLSIGLEDSRDLVADLDEALAS